MRIENAPAVKPSCNMRQKRPGALLRAVFDTITIIQFCIPKWGADPGSFRGKLSHHISCGRTIFQIAYGSSA